MTIAAGLLALLAVVLAWPLPALLARARWPVADPRAGLVLWQAVGLAGGLAAIGAPLLVGLAPLGRSLPDIVSGNRLPVSTLGAVEVGALLLAAALALRLLGVLARSVLRTLRVRRRHRALVDLVATPWPSLGGAHVLASPGAVAYCLPGLRPRVVVSRGTLDALDEEETAAVLAHERAHAVGRHDLVVLPFVALGATFPRLPSVRLAQRTVAFLVEALADDVARRSRSATALASALVRVGSAPVPGETLAVSGSPTAARGRRLLDPPAPVPVWLRALVWSSALGLVAVPTALLLLLPLVD